MRLKVLPLERWMVDDVDPDCWYADRLLGSGTYPEVPPSFKRDGIYLQGKKCWIEVCGRAFQYDVASFKFELGIRKAEKFNDKQIAALREICRQKLATRQQCMLLIDIDNAIQSKQTYRQARMHFLKTP